MTNSYANDSKNLYRDTPSIVLLLQSNPFDINDEKSYMQDDWDSMSQLESSQYEDDASPFNPIQDPFTDNRILIYISYFTSVTI
ncbi:BBT_HP_G0132280.mRNA.1.CDS.1 [Saccharomyces cerevisiae]|nr:BBT_HP_G0132280.mRNA.1.CDS.1 [Saccharomyces cerevisiae]CAI6975929.1 BBT_HP_G0132280.mRNA.1.CDS.1 [Saccharomyces cerevisiae]